MGQPQCARQQVEDPADTQAASHVPQSAWWLLGLTTSPCGCTEEGAYPPVVSVRPSGTAVLGVRGFPRRLSRRADKGLRATSSVYSPLGDVHPEYLSTILKSLASAIFSRMVQGIMGEPAGYSPGIALAPLVTVVTATRTRRLMVGSMHWRSLGCSMGSSTTRRSTAGDT